MILGAALGWLAAPAAAQDEAATQPAAGEAPAAPAGAAMQVTVASVSGIAEKRSAADPEGKWQPVQAGEALDEMTVLRTGLGAEVVLKFADRGEVTLRGGTKVGIGEFRRDGEVVKARLGMKYGAMQTSVDPARGPNDFRVTTPVATLSVRGTRGRWAYWGDFGFFLKGDEGHLGAGTDDFQTLVGAGESTDGDLTKSVVLEKLGRLVLLGDALGGLTKREILNYMRNPGGKGVLDFTGGGNTGTPLLPPPSGGRNYDDGYHNGISPGTGCPSCLTLER